MSYLLDLVQSFDAEEMKAFRRMNLIGKEEMIRDEYAKEGQKEGFNESLIGEKYQLTKTHFDKITSTLTGKTLAHFAGEKQGNQFEFLAGKQLYDMLLHQLKITEKKLKQKKDKGALTQFYKDACRVTILFMFNSYPEKEIVYYTDCYVRILGKTDLEEQYKVRAKQEEMIIRYHYHRKDGKRRIREGFKTLKQLEKEVQGKKFYQAEMSIHVGLSAYYDTLDTKKSMEYLLKADEAARHVYHRISERDKAFLLAMVANMMIDLGMYKEGIAKYEESFDKFGHLFRGRIFHPYNYVFGLLIEKDLDKASAVMRDYIDPILKNANARNSRFDILRLHAICHLLRHETEQAGEKLREIMQMSKEDFTPLGDVLFRFVHNVYCVQTGDYTLASSVLKKNLKFMQSKIDITGFEVYKKMFEALGKVIKIKAGNKPVPKPFIASGLWPGKGKSRVYQHLLELPFER